MAMKTNNNGTKDDEASMEKVFAEVKLLNPSNLESSVNFFRWGKTFYGDNSNHVRFCMLYFQITLYFITSLHYYTFNTWRATKFSS
jgi:hypothetical protein